MLRLLEMTTPAQPANAGSEDSRPTRKCGKELHGFSSKGSVRRRLEAWRLELNSLRTASEGSASCFVFGACDALRFDSMASQTWQSCNATVSHVPALSHH